MFLMDAHAFLDKGSVTDLLACVFQRQLFANLGGLSNRMLSAHTCSSVNIAWGIADVHTQMTAFSSNNNRMKEKPIQSFMPQVEPHKSFGDLYVVLPLICHPSICPPPSFLPKQNRKWVNMSTKCAAALSVKYVQEGQRTPTALRTALKSLRLVFLYRNPQSHKWLKCEVVPANWLLNTRIKHDFCPDVTVLLYNSCIQQPHYYYYYFWLNDWILDTVNHAELLGLQLKPLPLEGASPSEVLAWDRQAGGAERRCGEVAAVSEVNSLNHNLSCILHWSVFGY